MYELVKENKPFKNKTKDNWAWWCTPLIPALRRQRQAELYEFKASLAYTEKPCLE